MEHPFVVIDRICKEKQVTPGEMLAYFLGWLQETHHSATAAGLGNIASQGFNAHTEIQSIMASMQRPNDVPPSLLVFFDTMLQCHYMMDRNNAEVRREAGQKPQGEALQRRALAAEALCLIVRELANQAEHSGIEAGIRLEEFGKRQGFRFPKQNDPPHNQGE
ncbi:MAG: hypothetical protein ABSH22_15350 [Tepidisphaeraceae bacterium]|jgi:hypothetical protein